MVIAIPFFDMDLYLCVRNIGVNDVLINHYIYISSFEDDRVWLQLKKLIVFYCSTSLQTLFDVCSLLAK